MEGNDAWLCQGDIFDRVPVLDVTVGAAGALTASLQPGPAVLLTHDCAMDKVNPDGTLRLERFQFARLRSIQSLQDHQVASMRGARGTVGPFEFLWLGEVNGHGESFIYLSDPYYLPSTFFAPTFVQYDDREPDGSPSQARATPGANDSRIGRLRPAEIDLLRLKILAFWTRLKPAPPTV